MSLITKITAPNPGVFTGGGTNTYLVGKNDLTLIDPAGSAKPIQTLLAGGAVRQSNIIANLSRR